jgi:hypothetical protein
MMTGKDSRIEQDMTGHEDKTGHENRTGQDRTRNPGKDKT